MGVIFIVAGIFALAMVTSFNSSVPSWAQSGFESFDFIPAFFPMIIGVIMLIYGLSPGQEFPTQLPTQTSASPQEVIQKEVIVKVRCSYCGNLYDETLDKCPNCGAGR